MPDSLLEASRPPTTARVARVTPGRARGRGDVESTLGIEPRPPTPIAAGARHRRRRSLRRLRRSSAPLAPGSRDGNVPAISSSRSTSRRRGTNRRRGSAVRFATVAVLAGARARRDGRVPRVRRAHGLGRVARASPTPPAVELDPAPSAPITPPPRPSIERDTTAIATAPATRDQGSPRRIELSDPSRPARARRAAARARRTREAEEIDLRPGRPLTPPPPLPPIHRLRIPPSAILAGRLRDIVRIRCRHSPLRSSSESTRWAQRSAAEAWRPSTSVAPRARTATEERVALKVIRDELAHDEQFKSMFIDEAKILAQLSHPNVIRTLEYGVTGAPSLHRDGAALGPHLFGRLGAARRQGRAACTSWLAAWLCARVAEGLHSAHELVDERGQSLGVIHRDVNPSNIFLTHGGEVKLIDFGLAKARVRLSKSADGIVKGKIPYLAPEQAHGQAHRSPHRRLRPRRDALGVGHDEAPVQARHRRRHACARSARRRCPTSRTMIEGFPDELWYIIEKSLREDRGRALRDGRRVPQGARRVRRRARAGDEGRARGAADAALSRARRRARHSGSGRDVGARAEAHDAAARRRCRSRRRACSRWRTRASREIGTDPDVERRRPTRGQPDARRRRRSCAHPRRRPPTPPKGKTKAKGKSKAKAQDQELATAAREGDERTSEAPAARAACARTEARGKRAVKRVASTDRVTAVRDEAAPKRMWVSLVVVVAVVLALALALSAR